MEERVNIAELLRDCPKGMELDCVMYDNVKFDYVLEGHSSPIKVDSPAGQISLDKYGCYSNNKQAKCVIFPKGKTTWEGFIPPREFKNGDIIFTRTFDATWVSIFKQFSEDMCCTYIDLCIDDNEIFNTWGVCHIEEIKEQRLATEKEKLKLFDAISAYNYESNEETKTLEKLPKFKVCDWLQYRNAKPFFVEEITEQGYVNGNSCLPFEWENEIHIWTIQDAKDGDILCSGQLILIFKKWESNDWNFAIAHAGIDVSGKLQITDKHWLISNSAHLATEEQRDLLLQKMIEAGYEWDAENKELKKIEKTPAWSEEDEIALGDVLWCCKQAASIAKDENDMGNIWYAENWLKSLKDRCIWKPSDKQMEQLGWIAEQNKNNMIGQELMTLYNDLKKLKK